MADNKTYYYMRIKESFFEDDNLKIIEGIPNEGYKYSNILLKLYLRSLKYGGRLMLNNTIPYNINMIASITGHDESTCKCALELFENMGLIERLDNGAIYMLNIQQLIGKSSTEADRIRDYRDKIKQEKLGCTNVQHLLQKCTPEIEIELEKEIETEIEIETEVAPTAPVDYQRIINAYNSICISFPKVKSLSTDRKKAIKARLNTYSEVDFITLFENAEASDFLKGKNDRNWSATFDWLIKDKNMAKVLDGNYANRASTKSDKWKEALERADGEGNYNIFSVP